ncbi:MAG: efflux transporter outer membrane subunit [Burkholderiaceae bacterium]|nr:efflux transporter outer membrane subunit [Burkholderiaceae bacterium]
MKTPPASLVPFAPVRPASIALAAVLASAFVLTLSACTVGPAYQRPTLHLPANWKEAPTAPGWVPAAPGDALDRGAWWETFGDPQLNALAQRVQISNQNIAAAVAAYTQAQAAVREQRSGLFPGASLGLGASRTGVRGQSGSARTVKSGSFSADWAPDLWGKLRESVASAKAQAQASEAELASARLSAIGALATNYFSLREADVELDTLRKTIAGYERSLTITSNRYAAGIAAQTDVLQAQTTLASARANLAALRQTRAAHEHAIAVLLGVTPADFHIDAGTDWKPVRPEVPLAVPSQLLQRRPDIAAAERAVAAANAQIGIARSAYFPSLNLSASLGNASAGSFANVLGSGAVWALGLSVSQLLFDAGATSARVDQSYAAREQTIAQYRQTVLMAFQSVEDQLSALDNLAQQEQQQRLASEAADKTEQRIFNSYQQGLSDYTAVVTAQATALSARRALLQVQVARQNAVVALIQSLGGGWQAQWMQAHQPHQSYNGFKNGTENRRL